MSDIAVGIKDILVANSVGTFGAGSGWRIFIAAEPDEPDTVITIYPTGSWRAPDPKWLLDFPSAQVRIRGAASGYQAAQAKGQEVKDRLLGLEPQTLNSDFWRSVTIRSDLSFIMRDQKERPVFTINFALIIEAATSAQSSRAALS